MSKKIKVHILASPHPQFDEILDFPPENIEYSVNRAKLKYHGLVAEKRIDIHNTLLKILPIPRMIHTITNADIVHSTRGIIQLFQKKPWIIDCENGDVFTSFNREAMKNPIVRWIITNALKSKKCKKILPQSNAAKEDFKRALGQKNYEKIKGKVEVLYLAMKSYKKEKIKRKDKKVVLSYVGWGFYGKGGHNLIEAYKILTKKYKNLELKFKGDIPEEYLKKVKNLSGFKHIEKYFQRDKLFEEMYLSADIFVLPTNKDHYGVVFLEAMSAGLPLVGTKSFTVPELIEDGKNGFLVDTDYSWEYYEKRSERSRLKEHLWHKPHEKTIKHLVEKLSILIENKKLREKMGKESKRIIEVGHLSIKERNKKLRRIYEDILK